MGHARAVLEEEFQKGMKKLVESLNIKTESGYS